MRLILMIFGIVLSMALFGLAQQSQLKPPDPAQPPPVNLFTELGRCHAQIAQFQDAATTRENQLLTWAMQEITKRDAEIAQLKAQEKKP